MSESPPFVAHDLPVRGLRLRLWDGGGEGAPVLFLHGYLDTGRSFARVAERLGPRWRALCLDWRGHGGSRPVPEGFSFHQLDHLKDLAAVVDAVAPRCVVAHSMGGTIAFLFAASRPGAVPDYLLLDSYGGFASTPADQADALGKLLEAEAAPKRPFRSFPDRAAAIARVRANNPGLSEAGAACMVDGATEPDPDGGLRFCFDPRLRGPNPLRLAEATWRELGLRLQDRVRVLLGEQGLPARFPGLAARLAAQPAVQVQTVAGAGHHLHLDAPQAVADAIEATEG